MNPQEIHSRYTEVMKRYMDERPQDRVRGHGNDPLLAELDYFECAMLDTPPMGQRKGLVLPGEMETPKGVPMLASLTLEDADIKVLTDSEIVDIISDSNRTPPDYYVRDVHNQKNVGSCAAEGSSGSMACRRNQDGSDTPTLNPYAMYHTTSGGSDRGSTLHDNLAFLQEFGCPSEKIWPRSKGWRTKPSAEAMEDALSYRLSLDGVVKVNNRREFWTMILAGFPVYFGYTGHAIFASNVLDLDRFTYVNSWDESWGDNGRGTLSSSRIYWGYGAYAVIAARGKD